jgi:hypothetical protein
VKFRSGDEIRNENKLLVGTIMSKTRNSLTLNAVANVVTGDFVFCSNPQSAESSGISLICKSKATLSKTLRLRFLSTVRFQNHIH